MESNKRTIGFLVALFVIWLVVQIQREKPDKRIGHLNDDTFAAAITPHTMALVEFGAPWCGPCRQVQPALNRLARKYSDTIVFYQVNIDKAPNLKNLHAANGIPRVALYVNGKEKGALLGAHRYERYHDLIKKHLPQPKHTGTLQ